MNRFVVWGMGLAVSAVMGVSVAAQPVTDVEVTGGSGLLNFDPIGSRTFVLLSTFSTAPTVLTFTRADDAVALPLTLSQINGTATAWQGVAFSLSGGSFAALPVPTFGGLPGTVFGAGDVQARLLSLANPATFASSDLEIDLGQGTQVVLTITPIVPEPTAGAVVFTTLLLGRRRVRG